MFKKNKKVEPMAMPKSLNTYLGPKGYTLIKSELTDEQIAWIKNALTVQPCTPGLTTVACSSFPAYRESSQKLYVPRYFGTELFGSPKQIKIPDGDNIDVPFAGKLRNYQQDVVDAYVKATESGPVCGGGLATLGCGAGKTVIGLNIISTMKKKALIIVHKEFLVNQWLERIKEYLPSARVGKIQGQVIDIDNKDIVIGMLQSLSMKDYPDHVFSSFGLLLIDEVHHIGSEVFSCSLFKIVTKYTLGLSATMDRKDGTTYVFKMFLGDILYKMLNKKQRSVEVRGLYYKADDAEFNKVEYDFRGNPAYSTMISKLCEYKPRTEFIIKALKDLLIEFPGIQVMVIAHYKNILKDIHDRVLNDGFATVGYYVGGMKEQALKKTEDKQVVIASFAMASEGLDLRTLSGLIMVTPKTDIEQTVGRILRSDHEKPIVIDIVDHHEPFQKQWAKRKTFYRKENYKIIKTTNVEYPGGWTTVYNPKVIASESSSDEDEEIVTKSSGCQIDLSVFS